MKHPISTIEHITIELQELRDDIKSIKANFKNFGEYQLCPKCNGSGYIQTYVGTIDSTTCDVCNGAKILIKPMIG